MGDVGSTWPDNALATVYNVPDGRIADKSGQVLAWFLSLETAVAAEVVSRQLSVSSGKRARSVRGSRPGNR